MIALFTGKDVWNNGNPSPGMSDHYNALRKQFKPELNVQQWTWDAKPNLSQFDPPDEPVLLIGHSFGGFTAWVLAYDLNRMRPNQPVYLVMLDPVCWDTNLTDGMDESAIAQWIVGKVPITPNVITAICLLCTAVDPVRNCQIANPVPNKYENEFVPHTNHDSIIVDGRTSFVIHETAKLLFPGKVAA